MVVSFYPKNLIFLKWKDEIPLIEAYWLLVLTFLHFVLSINLHLKRGEFVTNNCFFVTMEFQTDGAEGVKLTRCPKANWTRYNHRKDVTYHA